MGPNDGRPTRRWRRRVARREGQRRNAVGPPRQRTFSRTGEDWPDAGNGNRDLIRGQGPEGIRSRLCYYYI